MEFDMDMEQRRLDNKISQLREKSYISDDLIDLLDEVAHLQLAAREEAVVVLPKDQDLAPAESVFQGLSLVAKEEFPYDAAQGEVLLGQVLDLLTKRGGPLGEGATVIKSALDAEEFTPAELFEKFIQDDEKFFMSWVERTPETPKIMAFLAFASLGPSIESAAEQLAEKLPEMKVHAVGTCPVCGSLPLISSLNKKEGFRHATCSFCRHDYRIKRIACPVCGEEEQKKLTFFTVDEEPGFRVDVCDSCKTYIKTIDFRELDRIAIPVLDDLDSLALDYVAAGQGYRRATVSAWGF